MKKIIALVLALVFVMSLAACGKSEEEIALEQAVTNVETLINEIGTVTTESDNAITKAEKAYNNLSADEQAKVLNYNTLQKAKDEYEKLVTDFLIGRWERNRVAEFDYEEFSTGDSLKDTIVIFDGYSRLRIVNTTKHNIIVGDYTYEWLIEDGLLKFKVHATDEKDVFKYRIDFKNETLTSVGNTDDLFYKKSDDPDYYLN